MEVKIKSQKKIKDKTCKICKINKPIIQFAIKDGSSDGFTPFCRACETIKNKKKYILKNKGFVKIEV
jgi:hypothetical protein